MVSPLGLPGQPAKDAFTIGSDGRLIKADGLPAVRLQSEVLGESETIKDILSRHNLADDDKTQVMLKALNSLQGAFYIDISRSRAANESFTFGWLRTRVGL